MMIKTLLVCFLLCSLVFASPVPAEDTQAEERVDRGLLEDLFDSRESGESGESGVPDSIADLLIEMIRDLVINQINAILGITTTTTTTTTTP